MELNQITLPATDISASVAFYRLLGCAVIVESAHYARFCSPVGDATFSVHLNAGGKPSAGQAVIYFECGALDERVALLQSLGLVFEQAAHDAPWLWREARLRDPAGNEICLYRAGENRLNPPWRVGGPQELGLQAVPLTTPRLQLRGLEYRDLPEFYAINSDPQVTRYLPYATWQSMDDAITWYHRIKGLLCKGKMAYWVVTDVDNGAV